MSNQESQTEPRKPLQELRDLQQAIYTTARQKGWWEPAKWLSHPHILQAMKNLPDDLRQEMERSAQRPVSETIALMHSELSEALEGARHHNPPDDKIPEFTAIEAELADVIIRVLDAAEHYGYRVIDALIAKAAYNSTRAHRHGGKAF